MKQFLTTALLLSGSALAVSTTGTLTITTTVNASCTLASATLNLGNYNFVSGSTGTANLAVTCNVPTLFTVSTNNGQNYSGGLRMKHSTLDKYLNYTMVTTPVGFSTGATPLTGGDFTTNVAVAITATGAQVTSAGTYSDVVTLTLEY
ncbi:spore coat protein U domain-containing protein [Deinococcus depolymerans]|uniref:Spore coat protein U/FanG domain-containing protein n=1 Tax=Deinococcus depolymerans TaxID=392408 RepID=A0ABN1BPK9_9DEIO